MTNDKLKTVAIIISAGQGKRMGGPKSFIKIAGRPILWWTLSAFEKTKIIDGIILVINQEEISLAKKLKFSKIFKIVVGGKRRQDSVFNGLKVVPKTAKIIVIHDGVRPLVTSKIITEVVRKAKKFGAVVVGVPVKDTIKQIQNPPRFYRDKIQNKSPIPNPKSQKIVVEKTLDRNKLWSAQTPQVFGKDIMQKAYQLGYTKYQATDDSFLVEKAGYPVYMIMGSYDNIKITTPEDLILVEAILGRRKSKA